jgi:hypothetical protein
VAEFERNKPGERLDFGGMSIAQPLDMLPKGKSAFAQNVRRFIKGAIKGRNLLTDAIYTLTAAVHSLRRLNDSTTTPGFYSLINGAGTVLSVWNSATLGLAKVASGLSGNQVSMVPFRPNTSVQPWMYIGDSAAQDSVTLHTQYLNSLTNPQILPPVAVDFLSNGMLKVRSDGLTYKMGIKEPQLAPMVSTGPTSVAIGGPTGAILLATTIPWTNYNGVNSAYSYGETNGYPKVPSDGTAPFIINVAHASTVTINSLSGIATINGASATNTTPGPNPSAATSPGHFVMVKGTGTTPPGSASVVIGAFTDGAGNVIPAGVAPLYFPSVVDVGMSIGVPIYVPSAARTFQIGINSVGNTFAANAGSFILTGTVTTNSLPTVTSTLGTLTASYFGDSPTSGPVSAYIWKNPDDPGGGGPIRSTSNAAGSTSGNSFIFDATFVAGIPELPGIGQPALAMQWTTLTPESVASGSAPLFAAPITTTYPTNTQFANFNFCLTGDIFFPAAGQYTLVLTNHDDCIWGIGGGVTLVSATSTNTGAGSTPSLSSFGQTITVVGGYPLLPRGPYPSGAGGQYSTTTATVSVPSAGLYPIEIDGDYWYHSGRIFLLMASPNFIGSGNSAPTIIPPLPADVRQLVQYRYVYRSSATGALSNPSPESTAETVPVTANSVTSFWSNDPQVDVVDYYRIDSVTTSYTYVATGPNDNLGSGGTNTPITDTLLDTELGTQLLEYDNYEPFPSIDLPQKGICNVSGGVITYVSGGAIGGTETGFNPRWLFGTIITIGTPTSLAYTMIARPSPTSQTSGLAVSSASVGTSVGGGVAWTNPGNVDSSSSFASVSLTSTGGTTYTPSGMSGSATVSATPANQSPPPQFTVLGGFASVAASAATLSVTINGSAVITQGGGAVVLSSSKDSGATWQSAGGWGSTFGPVVIPITLTGLTNLNTVMLQIEVTAGCGPSGSATLTGNVQSWFATVPSGGSSPTAQTLQAAVTGLSVPAGATITGLGISLNADYTGMAPSFMVGLNVGNVEPSFALTTSPVVYTAGGSTTLWGYSAWTNATLASLDVNFFASSTGTTTVNVNTLVVTAYYTQTVNVPTITIPGVPDGSNLVYEIEEPQLAAQPLPYLFGPTDNVNFELGVGDPLRPGTVYWSKGSNLDSAPDTNQQDLTHPGEALVNGDMAGGLGVVFSIRRAWLITPNFFNALATVTGTSGSTWSFQESSITRGLYIPRCVCVSGGGNIFFRVDDGIHVSPGGGGSQSITDENLYPLFPHENEDGGTSVPQPVTIAGYTIYPPDDSKPQLQRFSYNNGYMYYDFIGTDAFPHTLVFDEQAMGWVWDVYTPPVTIHATNEGLSAQGVLAGCSDGTVRQLASGGTEIATAVVLTPAADKADTRASAKWGDLYIETTNP